MYIYIYNFFCCNEFYSGVTVATSVQHLCNFVFLFACLSLLYVPFHVTVLLFIVANRFQKQTVKFNSEQTLYKDIGRCQDET